MTDTWNGLQVPWVARWSGEVVKAPVSVGTLANGGIEVFYDDGVEIRDDYGVLWMREGVTRGGEPYLGQVSVHRQRACMRRRACQVCGRKIDTPVIRWLLHPKQIVTRPDGRTITMSPPTCDECVELSKSQCPVMKNERVIVKVLEYKTWGVMGMLARLSQDGTVQKADQCMIEYARTDYDFTFKQIIAKQQLVEWTKWVVE